MLPNLVEGLFWRFSTKLEAGKYFIIGKINKPVGLKGYFKIESYCQQKEDIFNYKYLNIKEGDSYKEIAITKKYISNKNFVVSSESVDNKEDAEELKGKYIYLKNSDREILDDNEYYFNDLIECIIKAEDIDFEGKIKRALNYGTCDIVEVYFENIEKDVLIPILNENIIKLDIENKIIIFKELKEYL